jgi:hypothetical protein
VSGGTEEWGGLEGPRGVPDKDALDLLMADAAGRAAAMLAGADAAAEDPLVDAVRMLASPGGAPRAGAAARLTGIPEDELRRLVLAYARGGAGGVSAAVGASACDPGLLEDATAEVRARRAFAVGDLDVSQGTIADPGAGVRIRLGTDGRWYPFTSARDEWWPAPGAADSAGAAYQAALRARSLRRAAR